MPGELMHRLRAGLLAVLIALGASFSLVVTAGGAAADTPVDPRSAYQAPVEWPHSPQEAYNNIIAYLSGNRSCQDALCGPGADQAGAPFPVIEQMATKLGGTPAQVAAGEKMASKACKTGYGCVGVLAAMLGLGALGTADVWGPWVQQLGGAGAPVPEPVFYNSARNPYCNLNSVTGMSWETTAPWSWTCVSNFTVGATNIFGGWAYDVVNKTTGEWQHYRTAVMWGGTWHASETITQSSRITAGGIGDSSAWELRRVHWIEDTTATALYGSIGGNRGFYWGQELPPKLGNIESLTRCQRPNGSTYDVVTVEPVGSGMTGVPACNAGDTPVYTQTTLIDPDGTRNVQTSQRLNTSQTANEQFPLCVTNGCKWMVKVNGVPCTVGAAACVEWARDKGNATCWYGPYQMPIGLCYPYERSYEPGIEVPITGPNTDGDPDTHDGPQPQLQPTSNPTSTSTVTTTTQPTTSPTTTGTTTPTTSPTTNPSGSPTPTPSTPPEPTPCSAGQACTEPPGGEETAECFPTGWAAFNPAEWVLKPIRCALEPDPQLTQTRINSIRTKIGTSGPGPAITQVSTILESVPAASGCKGPGMNFTLGGNAFSIYLFDACDDPMATAAGYVKAFSTVVLVVTGVLAIARALGAAFGFNFSMGRGGSDGD